MRWDELVPIVHSMTNCFGIPKMVLIHCGGNDIGIDPCGKLLFIWNLLFMLLAKCYQDQWLFIQIFCLGVHGVIQITHMLWNVQENV